MHTDLLSLSPAIQHIVQNTLHKFLTFFSSPFSISRQLGSLSSQARELVNESTQHIFQSFDMYVNKHDRAEQRAGEKREERKKIAFLPPFFMLAAHKSKADNFIPQFHNSFDLLFHPNWTRIYWMVGTERVTTLIEFLAHWRFVCKFSNLHMVNKQTTELAPKKKDV